MKIARLVPPAICAVLAASSESAQGSDANTHFAVIVPANNDNNGRDSTLVVTSHADGAIVRVVDTDEDGDSDDSVEATLDRGESILVRIKDGDVNDDAGGKWDGDRFIIDSDLPVTVMLQTRSDWQHDWVPAEGRTMRGNEFFVHGVTNSWDIDVVAYEDNTNVEIYEVTTAAKQDSGVTQVELPGRLLVRQTLNRGEDLFKHKSGAGNDVSRAGHTYHILTSKPSTVAYGSLNRRARDGGGYVPSENGTTMGTHFYLPAIAEAWAPHEKELRIVAGDSSSDVNVRGWNESEGWYEIAQEQLNAYGHLDYTGRSSWDLRRAEFLEVTGTEPLNVFFANWLETGAVGTSDVFTYVSALDSVGASDVGREFVAYIGPPGREERVAGVGASFSHLFAAGFRAGTEVAVVDVDTDGDIIDRTVMIENVDDVVDIRISVDEYNQLNRPNDGVRPYLRVIASEPISLAMNNWNDNWLAFASGLLGADLQVEVEGPEEMPCNRIQESQVTVSNVGEVDVQNVELQFSPVGPLAIVDAPGNIDAIASGDSVTVPLTSEVHCEDVTTGELVGIGATASTDSGTDSEVSIAHKQTFTAPTRVPERAGIFNFSKRRDGCAVELSWVTEEDGEVEYVILRSLANDEDDELVEVGRVESIGIAASGFAYGFRDTTAEQLMRYQYFVSAVRDGIEETLAGPVRATPGRPFSEVPESTGTLIADYAGLGVIVEDGEDFDDHPGYDVDAIGISYDSINDKLFLGASARGVLGDADGDDDPDSSSDNGVSDPFEFTDDETMTFILDLDDDGNPDALAGVPLGGGLDLLQVGIYNADVADQSPTLGFEPLPVELRGVVTADVLQRPNDDSPDIEIVVNNPALLLAYLNDSEPEPLEDIGFGYYIAALSVSDTPDRVPDEGLASTSVENNRALGCGDPTDQIHLGTFAAFGNIFTGTPDFDFVPFGWRDLGNGDELANPRRPVPGEVIASPTVFLNKGYVNLQGTLHEAGYGDEFDVNIEDYHVSQNGSFVHISEIEYRFPAADTSRYENIDLQVFRLFTLDCGVTVRVKQSGTSGPMLDDRQVLLASGDIETLTDLNPSLTLAHTGLGTFERGGNMNRFAFAQPEDWTELLGPETAPAFTQYAFLDANSYHNLEEGPPEEDIIYPLGEEGVELPAGIWFTNHYLWTYANSGFTRVETIFEPGPDCGGSL